MQLRRLHQQIKLAIKVKSSQSHTATSIFSDHWTLHYGKYTNNKRPIAIKVSEFFDSFDIEIVRCTQFATTPPWSVKMLDVDTSLSTYVNKKEAPELLASIVRSKIYYEFSGYVHIYTDASKTTSGRVGIGCYIQSTLTTPEYVFEARLTDGVSVYTGEMTAVKLAVEKVLMLESTTQHTKFAVFTDSLSTAQTFISGRANSRPALYAEILDLIHTVRGRIILVWLPSHIGIAGNEKADRLASLGTIRPTVDIKIGFELREAYEHADVYITNLWQQHWDSDPTGRHLYSIRPSVGHKEQHRFTSRSTEVTSFRLRLGKCRLNANLHQIGCHETGLCSHCQEPETIQHYIMDCQFNTVARALRTTCILRGEKSNVPSILQNNSLIEKIHKLSDRRL